MESGSSMYDDRLKGSAREFLFEASTSPNPSLQRRGRQAYG